MKTTLYVVIVATVFLFSAAMLAPSELNPADSCVFVDADLFTGSGVVIGVDTVLTAKHLIKGANKVTIRASDGSEYEMVDARLDKEDDLAVVTVDRPFSVKPLQLDATSLKVGDKITAYGFPFDLPMAVLEGKIVITDATITIGKDTLAHLAIHDAHTNPGCSGGPLVDEHGKVRAIQSVSAGTLCGATPVGVLDGF